MVGDLKKYLSDQCLWVDILHSTIFHILLNTKYSFQLWPEVAGCDQEGHHVAGHRNLQSVYYWENTFQDVLWKPQEHSQDTTYTIARVTWNVLRIIYQPQRIVNRMQGSRSLADESLYLTTNSIYLHKKKESLNILKYLLTCLSL